MVDSLKFQETGVLKRTGPRDIKPKMFENMLGTTDGFSLRHYTN